MEIPPDLEPAIFDAAVLASVQRLLPNDRVHIYLRDLERDYRLLVAQNGMSPNLQLQAHKIVSQAGMLGLTRMSECARSLEQACCSGFEQEAALLRCREAADDVCLFAFPAEKTFPACDL